MAGMALQVADVLGYKPTQEETNQANLRSLNEERGRQVKEGNKVGIKAIDDEIANVTGTAPKSQAGIGQQVVSELMGDVPKAKIDLANPRPEAAQPANIRYTNNPNAPEPAKSADREVVRGIASGLGRAVTGGYAGLAKLVTSGGDTEAAAAAVRTEQDKAYQPKGEGARTTMEALGSNYNPLNWIPNAAKAGAETAFEHGLIGPAGAAAVETAGTAVAPGLLLKGMRGAEFFKRPSEPKPRLTYAQAQEQMKAPPSPAQAHFDSVKDARSNGYVVTPRQANPTGTAANLYEGASGSAKMEKLASVKNQANTNRIIATEDLGLKPNEQITTKVLENIRAQEGAAYQAVKDSGITMKADEAYKKAVSDLHGDIKEALPGVVKTAEIDDLMKALSVEEMSPTAAITTVKVLRADATKNIKAGYQSPEKEALGFAQRKAASALDALIESNLKAAGKGELSDAYQAARVKIAKTHDIEAALNDATGNIDALTLAKMADKGKPLSGGTEKVAKFGRSFSGAARNVDTMKDAANFSFTDLAAGVLGGSMTPAGVLAVGARPAARSLALSGAGQKMFTPISAIGK